MMTWGAGQNTRKLMGMAALLSCAVLLAFCGSETNHDSAGKATRPAATKLTAAPTAKESARWAEAYGKLPLSFEENQGQIAREVRFVSHGKGYQLFLTPQEAILALLAGQQLDLSPLHRSARFQAMRKAWQEAQRQQQFTALRLQLEGANPNPQIDGLDRLPTRVNYFIGNNPRNWHTDVPSYSRVKYSEIYPGIDLIFYGNQRQLEYDFVVAPGADPSAIQLKLDGMQAMRVDAHGNLILSVPGGKVELQKPLIYQQIHGTRREIGSGFTIDRLNHVRFSVTTYDRTAPLILDPVLSYSTYLGGTALDGASAIAVDGSGDAFIAGTTVSTNFPSGAKGAFTTAPAGNVGASFVAELDPTGANLLYSTYLAGTITNANDGAFGIALDPTGKVYVTGQTSALDFPTTAANAFNPGPLAANPGTVYLTKLDPTVNGVPGLLYSTYVSGTGGEFANCVAADAAGNAYIGGQTFSTDFPTPAGAHPLQSAPSNASGTGFVTRIDTTKSGAASLIFSTYFGGNGANAATAGSIGYGDQVSGIAVDSSQNAYVTGQTTSTNSPASFITSGTAFQAAPPAGNTLGSAFVSKINTTGGTLTYSTYLAGSTGPDQAFAIALGPGNVAYITGQAHSADFPTTANSFDTTNGGLGRAIITLVDTTKSGASSVSYSTFLGGSNGDDGFGIAADSSGNAYVVGLTQSADFAGAGTLDALGALQTALLNPSDDAFVAKLNPGGGGKSDLLYATYYGGSGDGGDPDQGFGIAIDSANPPNAYIAGQTFSTDLPILSSFQSKLNGNGNPAAGNSDAFVAKLGLIPTMTVTPSPSFSFGTQTIGVASSAQKFTVTNNTANTATFSSIVTTGVSPVSNTDFKISTDGCSPSVAAGTQCQVSVTFTPSVTGAESATLIITSTVTNGGQTSAEILNVNLTGTGAVAAPAVTLAPTSLNFGNQQQGTTSAAKPVTLTNTGTAALTINSIAASGDFAATSTGASACPISPNTLSATAGSNTCTINVTFTPTTTGARAGMLSVADNAGGSPHTVSLSGNGTAAPAPAVTLSTNTLTFNPQMVTTTSASMPVTLTNSGTGPLTINSIAASGDFAATSTGATACPISPNTLSSTAGSNTCVINVTITPTTTGARAGNLTITDNASGSPHMVTLNGTGWDFTVTATSPQSGKSPLMFNATLTSLGGFTQAVAFTCTGAPATVTCSVASPVNGNANPQPVQVTLTRVGGGLLVPPSSPRMPLFSPWQVVPLLLALLLLFLLPRAKGLRVRLGLVTATVLLVLLAGCSGPGSAPQPINGSITITGQSTGTAGSVSHSTSAISFTVN